LYWSPTFAIIFPCFSFLFCMRAKTFTCSQFAYQRFLNCIIIKESEFWLMCFFTFLFFFQWFDW
jgi:hypothetical protein